ncbi:kinetochore scaffold 1 [Anguilla rostrata]|uniref:kinetochore scaffold 1 n=1 Tax=Anguilla rostrata TaxID=7938 RepID=UPI0030D433CF
MENPESKSEMDELKQPTKTKRRISSILKAPRTPLKSIATDNEDCQEETAKPTEKKRNSRRVSFASTNDIHVFVKDFKNGSSFENLLQDLSGTGEETLDNIGIHTVRDGGPQIIGMETLLNAPLHASQHQNKENIFGYGAQNDFCDKTVVFSEEDTAFMDMTHSHTIIIDNKEDGTDAAMSSCGNIDFTSAVGGAKTTGFDDSRKEGTVFESCSTSGKGPIKESELEDFLASLTQSSGSGRSSSNIKSTSSATPFTRVPSPAPKVDAKNFLAKLRAHRSVVDQENQVPVATRKSAHQDESSQQQSHWLSERTMILEQENMDLTKTHTAIIGDDGLFKRKSFALSGEQEDMEMTRSQTVVIDSRTCHMVNSSNGKARGLSMLAPNKTVMFSEADHDMDMTGPFTGCIEETQNPSTKRDERVRWLFPATNTISHLSQTDRMENTHTQIDPNVINCLWPASSDPEDMEMTRSQTVVIDSKNCQVTPSLGKRRSVSCMSAQNKTVMFSEADRDMEMTDAFTGHFEVNKYSSTQKDERSICFFPATKTISHAGQTDFIERTSRQMDANDYNNSLWPTTLSNPEDMEMTRSQTVVIDSKNCPITPSLGKRRSVSCMSAPNKTVMFSEVDHDMEMTDAFTGVFEINKYSSSQKDETSLWSFPATNTISGQKDFSKRTSSRMDANVCDKSLWSATLSNPDDMEMTRSQTVVIDSKNFPMKTASLSKVRNASCVSAPNKTIVFSEEDHSMEMTDVFPGHIEENRNASTKRNETTSRLFPTTNAIDHTGDADDMDMTRSQTVVIDSKNCPVNPSFGKVRSVSYLSVPNKTIMFSKVDDDMEMTGAFTGHIEENQNPSTDRHETFVAGNNQLITVAHTGQPDGMERTGNQRDVNVFHGSLPCPQSSNSDDMDMTRSQTVVIDSKNFPVNPSLGKVRRLSCLSPPNKTTVFSEVGHDMEMTDVFTGNIVENTRVRTGGNKMLDRLSTTKKNYECSGVWDSASDPNDMEMTRSRTVVIDSKYCGTAKASLSNMRKSLSCILPSSKPLMFPRGGVQVPKALIGLDMDCKKLLTSGCGTAAKLSPTTIKVTALDESEATGRAHSQIAACEPDYIEIRRKNVSESKYEVKQYPLPVTEKSNVYCGSDFNIKQISSEEDNGIEMIKTPAGHSVKSSHTDGDEAEMTFPSDKAKSTEISIQPASSGSGSTSEAASSEGVENEKNQSVCIISRNTEMVNSSTCIMRKGPLPDSSKTQLFSETDDMAADENTPASADEVERQVCSSPTTNSVPSPCLPNCQTVAEENTGQCDQIAFEGTTLMSADLTSLDEISCNAPLVNYTVISDEEMSHTANSENVFTTDSSGIGHDGKETEKRPKSRRMTLADFQSKLQNIGLMINEQSDLERGCHTVPIPRLTTPSSPEAREATCVQKVHSGIDDYSSGANLCMKPDHSKLDRQTNRTETFKLLNIKPWTTQLFVGGVLPKLPRRSMPLNLNREDPTGHSDIRMLPSKSKVGVTEKDGDHGEVKNIIEETLPEISSEEDLSETVEGNILRDRDQEASVSQALVDAEPIQNVTQGQKRPFPVDGHECDMPEERKMRSLTISNQNLEPSTNVVQWDSNVVDIVRENPPSFLTKTLDSTNFSSGTPNQRCEGTFEMSSHRTSQYDIQFDDPHEINFQQKLEDGSITMREFLKLFGIDFNIHRPRQSVLPENFETNSAPNSAAVLLEKHINRPKQRVYEEDCQELTEMVEKLKTRMRDQDKSLKTTNEALWEEAKTYSEEQLQSFGTKLKERKVYFRKQSKSLSHELKIGLYSKLVHTTQVAQQNLTEKIEDMDELLKHLDECLNDLQADLSSMDCAGVEEYSANSETKLTLELKQQELESLNMALADNERRVCELELEKNSTAGKVRKLQDETVELEKQITVLDRLTEWRLSEKTDDRAVFTFLYDSMGLEVLFEKPADKTMTGEETEQNVADITFQLELDEENSHCYARLVHSLLGQFIQNESSWAQRYPTSRHIPALLHDVALVVSRCRLLGEEIHRLQKWGSLRLDILEIGCVNSQVRILFSSLKACAKFELTLAVTPAYPFTGLQLINFQNYIGNTRIDQVEEIIAAETLAKNYLTRIVKRIHNVLLC